MKKTLILFISSMLLFGSACTKKSSSPAATGTTTTTTNTNTSPYYFKFAFKDTTYNLDANNPQYMSFDANVAGGYQYQIPVYIQRQALASTGLWAIR
jgi:hypothetical protein